MTEPVTRDLVDRTELRRRIEEIMPVPGLRVSIHLLDAMPSVECPRGWTRDEVLHELDTHPGAVCEHLGPYTGAWNALARNLVASWHPEVRRYDVRVVLPEPATVWVPLTKLVGRTLKGETAEVAGEPFYISGKGWHYQDADRWVHGIPVDLESGRVEVSSERCSYTFPLPSWMGPDQDDPCRCDLPEGHDGDHGCRHTRDEDCSDTELMARAGAEVAAMLRDGDT